MRLKGLKQRAEEPELMDDFTSGGRSLKEALRQLRWLNRIFGAAGPTLYGVKRLWLAAGKPSQMSILDIGSGSGDVNRILLRWADKHHIDLKIRLADITEEACGEARLLYQHESRIEVIQHDVFELQQGMADVITASQFVHHFSSKELPVIVGRMLSASRFGIVINDIHRHWIPWLAVWLVTRMLSRNRYIRHDGPLSVAKGFRLADWMSLKMSLKEGFPEIAFSFSWRPLFRYVAIGLKTSEEGSFEPLADNSDDRVDSEEKEAIGADQNGTDV
ncbi:methyltransferase domain-containing protein [Paenibacillus eucommiae]|uniref:2-polyprenyl-3-methyl-5-hydroxy-6-metoxy-1, 4-benzoquinol methylase n=1 Tax=Paenibacillus eucommiae TaxID=1355755 RepID=A0ABS4J250_9BACL|nr:methyltransferase domain-containing protein [Paenibacillus eucommiae]MBP1993922.1 2-polyprenyl-3-methyl-5-hydroxy-6-metoxy-1,4-benzoquinol methylase [Paenibacillus eucommiae]